MGTESNGPARTYILDLATGNTKPVAGPAAGISPDGRFVVVIASGKVAIHSVETGGETVVGTVDPSARVIRWSGDGHYVFFYRSDRDRVEILRLDVRTGRTELWREARMPDPAAEFFGSVTLSADGKSYAFSFQRDLATLYVVDGVK
jgi:Tol biopolymer transport system component